MLRDSYDLYYRTGDIVTLDGLIDPWHEVDIHSAQERLTSLEMMLEETRVELGMVKFEKQRATMKSLMVWTQGHSETALRSAFAGWKVLTESSRQAAQSVKKMKQAGQTVQAATKLSSSAARRAPRRSDSAVAASPKKAADGRPLQMQRSQTMAVPGVERDVVDAADASEAALLSPDALVSAEELTKRDLRIQELESEQTGFSNRIAELEQALAKAQQEAQLAAATAIRTKVAAGANGPTKKKTPEEVAKTSREYLTRLKGNAAELGKGREEVREMMSKLDRFRDQIAKW